MVYIVGVSDVCKSCLCAIMSMVWGYYGVGMELLLFNILMYRSFGLWLDAYNDGDVGVS